MYNYILLKEYEVTSSSFNGTGHWDPEQDLPKATQFFIGFRLESSLPISFPCGHFAIFMYEKYGTTANSYVFTY